MNGTYKILVVLACIAIVMFLGFFAAISTQSFIPQKVQSTYPVIKDSSSGSYIEDKTYDELRDELLYKLNH